jgi:hypothetical protein
VTIAAVTGCGGGSDAKSGDSPKAPAVSVTAASGPSSAQIPDDAPPPESTGGFDGKRAYGLVARQIGFGPRPAGSQALAQTQGFILSELSSCGCTVATHDFYADTPAGRLSMKNIVVKIPAEHPRPQTQIILLATHYDTKRLDNFVGADDGGSSTAVMLELARLLCATRGRHEVWIAFFDGEEAVGDWSKTDSRYGSREMAARMAMSGDLKRMKVMLLADIVGSKALRIERDGASSKSFTDLVWRTAARLGYGKIFVNDETSIEDDHQSFTWRGVPAVDVIDLQIPYWHTPQDTMDKISARSLAIVGHVFLETVKELQKR